MGLFNKFQALVGRDQGASRLFVRAAGFFNVGDSATVDGTDITGAVLKYALLSPVTKTSIVLSVGAAALTVNSTIPATYGVVAINHAGAASTVSLKLPSANVGATLFLNMRAWQSDISILPGNASIAMGPTLSDCSCILVVNGSVNSAWLELKCVNSGEWFVANHSNRTGVQVQASS